MRIATIIFTYNRPIHTYKTVEGLHRNETDPEKLFIFHDGMKENTNKSDWDKVERVIRSVDWCDCTVITSERNKGLASSVIDGVNHVFEEYDAVIVLEDDCVPHRLFMDYMSKALKQYEKEEMVYSIGAWAEPVDVPENGSDAFFVGRINSVGWATWKDRWASFRRDYDIVKEIRSNEITSKWLDIWGQDLICTLHENMEGRVDTWAAFWALSVINKRGLCLSPYYSLVENIGFDGTGVHSEEAEIDNKLLPDKHGEIRLPVSIEVIKGYEKTFANYYPHTESSVRENYYKSFMIGWYDLLKQKRDIADWFGLNNINRVCIWGLGEIGKRVVTAIKGSVTILVIIDAFKKDDYYDGIRVVKPSKVIDYSSEIEVIILVPGYDMDRVSSMIDECLVEKLIPLDYLLEQENA